MHKNNQINILQREDFSKKEDLLPEGFRISPFPIRKIKIPKKAKKSETLLTKTKKSSIIFGLSRREGREKPEKGEKIKKINFFLKKA